MHSRDILVIGGKGFIGEYLVTELKRHGKRVSIFDRHTRGSLESAVGKSSAVIFLVPTDLTLLKKTLKAITKHKIATFIYTSTLLLYKEGKNLRKESDPLFPISLYAKKKLKEEKTILDFKRKYPKINFIIARLGNVYGGVKNRGFIGLAFEQIFRKNDKKEIVINGDGENTRDYVLVDDVAKALHKLLLANKKVSIVNVATGSGSSVIEIIKYIEKETGGKLFYRFGPEVPETRYLVGNNTRLRKFVKWVPSTTVRDGLCKTYKRYMINASNQRAKK